MDLPTTDPGSDLCDLSDSADEGEDRYSDTIVVLFYNDLSDRAELGQRFRVLIA